MAASPWHGRSGADRPSNVRPTARAFGALLIRATIKDRLSGEISHDWKPEGLTIRLSVAKDRVITG